MKPLGLEETMLKKLQEAGWPAPIEIKCAKISINSVVNLIEKSHTRKAFYAEIIRWLIESEGKPTFKKVTGIESEDNIRKAMFGELENKEAIKRLITYVSEAAPGQLINFAKEILEPETAEYVKYYVTKTNPPEVEICDKLKKIGIYTISYIEDTLEYGPLCKFIINPQGLLHKIIEEPSKTAEFATVTRLIEWIISNTNENIVFIIDEETPNKAILASVSIEQRDQAIEFLRKILSEVKRIKIPDKNNIISAMFKYLL